jgi:hypothetical protein
MIIIPAEKNKKKVVLVVVEVAMVKDEMVRPAAREAVRERSSTRKREKEKVLQWCVVSGGVRW